MRCVSLIKSVGVDVTDVSRVARLLEKHGNSFSDRIFTESECVYCEQATSSEQSYAARFAAKEAVMKALRTGNAEGVRFVDIEVVRGEDGPPGIVLHGVAQELARAMGIESIHLSLSHTKSQAIAFCVAESKGEAS